MTRASAVLCLALAACGTDVLLGGADASLDAHGDLGAVDASMDAGVDAPLDAGTDAPMTTPFPDGDYTLTIAATQSMAMCTGSLAGMESAFASVTRDSLGLVSGPVTITSVDATNVDVSGATIDTDYLMSPVRITKGGGGPPIPANVWIGIGTRTGTGPLGTEVIAIDLEAFETTIAATGFDGRVSAEFVDLVTTDTCVVGFDATFRH